MPELLEKEVHVHLIHLPTTQCSSSTIDKILSHSELARCHSLKKAPLQHVFKQQKALTRLILAQYLDINPKDISYAYNTNKKPLLPKPFSFNISHSGDYLLLGITEDSNIGVDIEKHRPLDYDAIAKRFFSKDEYEQLQKADLAISEFFKIWTAKEAYVKALGTGVFHNLESFSINNINPEWTLHQIECPKETSAAVLVHSRKKIKKTSLTLKL